MLDNEELTCLFIKKTFDVGFPDFVLHWHNADAVIKNVKALLKPKKCFVFEMDSKGNGNSC